MTLRYSRWNRRRRGGKDRKLGQKQSPDLKPAHQSIELEQRVQSVTNNLEMEQKGRPDETPQQDIEVEQKILSDAESPEPSQKIPDLESQHQDIEVEQKEILPDLESQHQGTELEQKIFPVESQHEDIELEQKTPIESSTSSPITPGEPEQNHSLLQPPTSSSAPTSPQKPPTVEPNLHRQSTWSRIVAPTHKQKSTWSKMLEPSPGFFYFQIAYWWFHFIYTVVSKHFNYRGWHLYQAIGASVMNSGMASLFTTFLFSLRFENREKGKEIRDLNRRFFAPRKSETWFGAHTIMLGLPMVYMFTHSLPMGVVFAPIGIFLLIAGRLSGSLLHHGIKTANPKAIVGGQFLGTFAYLIWFQTFSNYGFLVYGGEDYHGSKYWKIIEKEWNLRSTECYFKSLTKSVDVLRFVSFF